MAKSTPALDAQNAFRVLCLLACALLAACGSADRAIASLAGHAERCIDGVKYLQFTSGVTVAYTKDGKVKTCE